MLPGFRVLLALVVLSFAILIFGFGAVALLRTAHENFASQPTWRAPQEVAIAPRNDRQTTLALLRVEPPGLDTATAQAPGAGNTSAALEPVVPQTLPADAPKPDATPNNSGNTDQSIAGTPAPETKAVVAPETDVAPPKQTIAALEQPAHEQAANAAADAAGVSSQTETASPHAPVDAANDAKTTDSPVAQIQSPDAAGTKTSATLPGPLPTSATPPAETSTAPAASAQVAALPDAAAGSEAASNATATDGAKTAVPDAKELAKRRARARFLRARRLAAARARAAKLAQNGQQNGQQYSQPFGQPFQQTTTTTRPAMTPTSPFATPGIR